MVKPFVSAGKVAEARRAGNGQARAGTDEDARITS
jgi:hypothetical protein